MGLVATGSLGEVRLQWTAATGDGLTGYRVYRSTDGIRFTLMAEPTVAAWTDAISSPGGDGVLYSYRVTAVGAAGESEPSSSVRSMHGIRLSGIHGGCNFSLSNTRPFVIDDAFHCQRNLYIFEGQQLYVLPGATLMLSNASTIFVYGTLQLLGTAGVPAVVSATQAGGLGEGEGFGLFFYPATATNIRMEHALLTNLNTNICLMNTIGIISNCKFYSTGAAGEGSFICVRIGMQAATITRCSFFRLYPSILHDVTGSTFSFTGNRLRGGKYAISTQWLEGPIVDPGMICGNDFDASVRSSGGEPRYVWLNNISGSGSIPLGGNYWHGGTNTPPLPQLLYESSPDVCCDFSPGLAAPPDDCGPTW
jgi:hypothetical protein